MSSTVCQPHFLLISTISPTLDPNYMNCLPLLKQMLLQPFPLVWSVRWPHLLFLTACPPFVAQRIHLLPHEALFNPPVLSDGSLLRMRGLGFWSLLGMHCTQLPEVSSLPLSSLRVGTWHTLGSDITLNLIQWLES